ncbi:hypothetical protein DL98DRAFT_582884 [Cadophora sp. DSE1049]|nr:hypothetical protein DL98DRAFT_582884 [Cadophora sp. DSE1049]
MTLSNYQEIPSDKEHGAQEYDKFKDWTILGAAEKNPALTNFKVTAANLEATIAFNTANEVLALDNLGHGEDIKNVPQAYLSELEKVTEFAKRHDITPKFIIVNNIVEKTTKPVLAKTKEDGLIRRKEPEFWYIVKNTKIGRMARRLGEVTGIYALELEKRGMSYEGPTLIFMYGDQHNTMEKFRMFFKSFKKENINEGDVSWNDAALPQVPAPERVQLSEDVISKLSMLALTA